MTARIAKERIEAAVLAAVGRLNGAGLLTKSRTFYTDKNLAESTEFSPSALLLFGDLAFGCDDMEDDDYCNYSICCEIKTGLVDEGELEAGIADFNNEIDSIIEKLANATSKSAFLEEISRKQAEEAEEAAREFAKEMRKVKIKLYSAVAAIVVIILAVLILVPIFT